MARINKVSIQNKLNNIPMKKFEPIASKYVNAKIKAAKDVLIANFWQDKVNVSLAAEEEGGDAGLLNGKGSLYGFIGFTKGEENPAEQLEKYLEKSIKVISKEKEVGKAVIKYSIFIPTEKDFEDNLNNPDWLGQRSWISAVRNGVGGLEYFIYTPDGKDEWESIASSDHSRSKAGLQSDTPLRADSMQGDKNYLTDILKEFITDVKSNTKTSYYADTNIYGSLTNP